MRIAAPVCALARKDTPVGAVIGRPSSPPVGAELEESRSMTISALSPRKDEKTEDGRTKKTVPLHERVVLMTAGRHQRDLFFCYRNADPSCGRQIFPHEKESLTIPKEEEKKKKK